MGTVGADYLGFLVLGLFNAVVGRERIPGHLHCRPAQGCWVSDTDRRLRLEVGTPVDFVVAQCAPGQYPRPHIVRLSASSCNHHAERHLSPYGHSICLPLHASR